MKDAYYQLELDKQIREIKTFIASKGVYRYKRLLFGVNSALKIFQKMMENILAPCENSLNYLDDQIVFGQTAEVHDENLKMVLQVFKTLMCYLIPINAYGK